MKMSSLKRLFLHFDCGYFVLFLLQLSVLAFSNIFLHLIEQRESEFVWFDLFH